MLVMFSSQSAVCIYYQFHLSVKTRLLKLQPLSKIFDLGICIFFAGQMESDMSIYFMPPTDREFKDEQSKSLFIFGPWHHS